MRAHIALSLAAALAALAGCGGDTGVAPVPLEAGRYAATFRGNLAGAAEGTAYVYDLGQTSSGPQIWVELRDERVQDRNTLVRFLIHGAMLTPGTHRVGGASSVNPLDAVALQFHAGASTADATFTGFTGTVSVQEASGGGLVGEFDVRNGTLYATGRFNAIESPF